MNIYRLIQLYRQIDSPRIKLAGILALHIAGRRYLNMVFDPVLSCNLRCRMCYFSDAEARESLHGSFNSEDIQAIARALFHRVLKLQIGCGAEPTVYKGLPELVYLAKSHGIPHISLTTNGQLLTREKLEQLTANGLQEIILSTHGLSKPVYEDMMQGASFEKFIQTLDAIKAVRESKAPGLQIRINYTVNADNIADLRLMPDMLASLRPDVVQLRPIQHIGESSYNNFSLDRLISQYDEYILPVVEYCATNNITCLYPERENLQELSGDGQDTSHSNSVVDLLPYFQLSPYEGWKTKIDPYRETFEDYARRTRRVRFMLSHLFGTGKAAEKEDGTTKMLNYNVKQ